MARCSASRRARCSSTPSSTTRCRHRSRGRSRGTVRGSGGASLHPPRCVAQDLGTKLESQSLIVGYPFHHQQQQQQQQQQGQCGDGAQRQRAHSAALGVEEETGEPPEEYLCPISYELMTDPVLLAESGHSYDRESLMEWFARGHNRDPKTNLPLRSVAVIPNHTLRQSIEAWRTRHGGGL